MQLTAAVINAGLGDLTLGLQMSGFQVIAAFEPEEKSALIHRHNLDTPLHPLSIEEIDANAFPCVDLLAAHLYHPSYSRVSSAKMERHDEHLYRLREILCVSRPRAFFLLINAASIKNDKHIYAYVRFLQENGKSAGYIMTELSAIRFWHKRSKCKNHLPDNKDLNLEKRQIGKYNRGLLESEYKSLCALAIKLDRLDVLYGVTLAYHFGLRKNELVTVRIWQLEEADANKQLHIPRGKGGRKRDVPVDTHEQSLVLKAILRYAKSKGKKSSDYLFCDNHKHSVKKEKDSITNWMSNHIDEILDPDRKLMVEKGRKARAEGGYGWHSLRHTYAQRTEKRLIACGMSLEWARKEVSERLGHGRPQVLKTYED